MAIICHTVTHLRIVIEQVYRTSAMLDGILVRLRVHTVVCERANNFDRVTQPRKANRRRLSDTTRNDNPIASEMSNELIFDAPGASGAFHSAHDFSIKDSTFVDVQGNYVSSRFVSCEDMIVTGYMPRSTTRLPRSRMVRHPYIKL
jgi:hypothetical protein